MITELFGVASSLLTGGATGILGVVLQRFFDNQAKKNETALVKLHLQNAIELKKLDMDIEQRKWQGALAIARDQAAASKVLAEIDARKAESSESGQSLRASFDSDQSRYLTDQILVNPSRFTRWTMTFVDAVRGLMRPLLTLYLCILTQLIYLDLISITSVKNAISTTNAQSLVDQVVSTVMYLASTAVVWWFGSRPVQKNGKGS